jgi:hypothetical protein
MAEQDHVEGWHQAPRYIAGAIIGALVFVGFPETARLLNGGAFAQTAPNGGNCNNYGPNGTIIGSCNTTINPVVHETNGLYQGDQRVGRIQRPSIDEARGIAHFAAANFSEYPDLNKPLEYGGLILNCDNVPRQEPNTFVGTLSATVIGFQCRIIGKAPPKPASSIGDNNTIVNAPTPQSMGSGNTIVGPTDQAGNAIVNKGGTTIGAGACGDSTSVVIGAGARQKACEPQK